MTRSRIELPYGRETVSVSVPDDKLIGICSPSSLPLIADPVEALRRAVANPVGRPALRAMAAGAGSVAIAIEDATRPVPSALLVDAAMTELRAAGVSPGQVTVIVATGLHRPMTDQELSVALGRWFGAVRCENHDAHDPQRLVPIGTTKLGTTISINRSFVEADLKITTVDVEYHQFCGYGGGVKCVYPGLADAAAIQANHARMDLPGTEPGRIEGNPVREEVDQVGRMVGVDFNVSVAMDAAHRLVAVRAGDPDQSFRQV